MAAKTSWHRYWTKLRHCHLMYTVRMPAHAADSKAKPAMPTWGGCGYQPTHRSLHASVRCPSVRLFVSVVYLPTGSRPKEGRWAPRLHSMGVVWHSFFISNGLIGVTNLWSGLAGCCGIYTEPYVCTGWRNIRWLELRKATIRSRRRPEVLL